MRLLAAAVILGMFSAQVWAEDRVGRMDADSLKNFQVDELNWQPEAILPPGAESVLLLGDPGKADMFVVLLRFPPNYPIPAHTHPFTEMVTVLQGEIGNGVGEALDREKGTLLQAGDSFVLPADMPHYLWTTDEETIIQLLATGPWGITYIDPADDPRN